MSKSMHLYLVCNFCMPKTRTVHDPLYKDLLSGSAIKGLFDGDWHGDNRLGSPPGQHCHCFQP